MTMRLWAWACWLVKPLFVVFAVAFFLPDPWGSWISFIAFAIAFPLGLIGGYFGLMMVMDRWQMRCPLCGTKGKASLNDKLGMWVECPQCGLVRVKIKLSGPRFEKV